MNIPIYRAKKIDSDEYVEGYYSPDKNFDKSIHTIFFFDKTYFEVERKTTVQIDPTTLSISFPDMLDSQGNRIFASLQDDGKGGDICGKEIIGYAHNKPELFTAITINGNTYAKYSKNDKELLFNLITSQARANKCKIKIVGIQE